MHYPPLWRFRLLRALKAKGSSENRRLLGAWATAEGGSARYNPLNTTQPWLGASNYNHVGVKNYPSAKAGIAATAATLTNGYYNGIVTCLRHGRWPAEHVVKSYAGEFDTWGTGWRHVLAVLEQQKT